MISPISTSTVSNTGWDITVKKKKRKEKKKEKRVRATRKPGTLKFLIFHKAKQGGGGQNRTTNFPRVLVFNSASQSPNFSPKWEISRSHPDDFIRTSIFFSLFFPLWSALVCFGLFWSVFGVQVGMQFCSSAGREITALVYVWIRRSTLFPTEFGVADMHWLL